MVILHSTFDPEKIIPDSNNAIQRENIFAVDCLIFDNRLLRCPKNDNAIVQTAHLFKSKVGMLNAKDTFVFTNCNDAFLLKI